jgi:UDP-glucose 4-epimerase
VDTIFSAFRQGKRGETYIPRVPSSKVMDIAHALIGDRKIKTVITGIRPGEKIHEILISEEEAHRTIERGDYYVIQPILPELCPQNEKAKPLDHEFSSKDNVMAPKELKETLVKFDLMVKEHQASDGELLR